MAAIAAGCRKTLVNARLAILRRVTGMVSIAAGCRKALVNARLAILRRVTGMVAIAAGCRKALVNARLAIQLSYTNGPRKRSFHLVGAPFLTFWAAFSPEERSLVGRP